MKTITATIAVMIGVIIGYLFGYRSSQVLAEIERTADQVRLAFQPHRCYWRELCEIHKVKGR